MGVGISSISQYTISCWQIKNTNYCTSISIPRLIWMEMQISGMKPQIAEYLQWGISETASTINSSGTFLDI